MSYAARMACSVTARVCWATRSIADTTACRGMGCGFANQWRCPATRSSTSRNACADAMTPRIFGVPALYFHGRAL